MRPWPALVAILMLSCRGRPEGLEHLQVTAAWLDDVQLASVGVIGGGVWGTGTLVVATPDAPNGIAYPVELAGGMLGAVVELDVDGVFKMNRAELRLPDHPISGNELLGRYHGGSAALTVGFGADHHTLRNRHGVHFAETYFSLGVGVMGAYEWLRIALDDDPRSPPPVDTSVVDTSVLDTADTAEPDTAALLPPTTSPPRSGGCGCGSPDPVGDTDADPTGDPDPTETEPGDGGSGCGGCGGSSGTCSTSRIPAPFWLVALLAPWVRRRR